MHLLAIPNLRRGNAFKTIMLPNTCLVSKREEPTSYQPWIMKKTFSTAKNTLLTVDMFKLKTKPSRSQMEYNSI